VKYLTEDWLPVSVLAHWDSECYFSYYLKAKEMKTMNTLINA